MARTRIKICGITRREDLEVAIDLGVDAVGLVFCDISARCIDISKAVELTQVAAPFVTLVGLFMDNTESEVADVLKHVSLDVLQFHGTEGAGFCRSFNCPYMKALPMKGDIDIRSYAEEFTDAIGFFADSHAPGQAGGSGKVFDWSSYPDYLDKPVILAGGLTPENVATAISQVKPYGVDVSSGVEQAKGIKDFEKMRKFVNEVNRVSR